MENKSLSLLYSSLLIESNVKISKPIAPSKKLF